MLSNGLVQAMQAAGRRARGKLLGILLQAAERRAQELELQRRENRGRRLYGRGIRLGVWGPPADPLLPLCR